MKKHLQIKMKVIFWGPKDNEKLLRLYKISQKLINQMLRYLFFGKIAFGPQIIKQVKKVDVLRGKMCVPTNIIDNSDFFD